MKQKRKINKNNNKRATKKNTTTKANDKLSKKVKKPKFSKRHPKLSIFIKLNIVLILAAIVIVAGIAVGMIYGMWGEEFEISEEELIIKGNSVIYDSEGTVLAELSGDENRKIIKLEDMAKHLPDAYISIEDERFRDHNGVDYKRTLGAIGTYILHKGSSSYGGSTITQQLVKNMTDAKEKNGIEGITRKIKEWAKAFQIERMLSKDQILELYLNVIFVGDKNYGVEVGAQYYFNKKAKDLSLAECAFMAGINNRPNYYNPYGKAEYGKDDTKTKEINNRTKTVLGKMLELGKITQEEYDKACKEVEKGLNFKKGNKKSMVYSYHTDATIAQVIKDFMEEKGWSQDYATTYVYGGGLKIYSTQNTKVQEKIEKTYVDNASTYIRKSKKISGTTSQSAMVVIDNDTGYVVGVVGGLGEKTESRGLNRATQSKRQTGSSMKPIADLVPGIQEGLINPATMYEDYKTEFPTYNKPPKDYDGFDNRSMSLREATMRSKNIPFIKVMAEVTNATSRSYLQKMGVTSLTDRDTGLSMAIGGLDEGISPLEMAGAYATISNDGVYRTPLFYTKIVDNNGTTVLEPKQEKREVFSKQTAYLIKDLLVSVVKGSRGTASYCAISGIDVAAKTGTTNSNNDKWLCGFTNYYTAATWYGFDKKEEVTGSMNPAGRIWAAVMKSLHSDKKNSKFEKPDGIVTVKVCSKTGLRATSKCSSTYSEIFAEGHVPEACDESGNAVEICEDTGKLATQYCPNKKTQYFSYTLPKERLGIWKTLKTDSKAPTDICTEHDETTNKDDKNKGLPTLTLVGKSTMNLKIGDTYSEQGAIAKDDTDGDITDKIQISGSVNTSKAGTYTVKYTVKNSKEKTVTITRTVIVKDNETQKPSTDDKPSTNENTTSDKPTSDDNKTNTTNTTNTTSNENKVGTPEKPNKEEN